MVIFQEHIGSVPRSLQVNVRSAPRSLRVNVRPSHLPQHEARANLGVYSPTSQAECVSVRHLNNPNLNKVSSHIARLDIIADTPLPSWQPRVKQRSRPHLRQFTRISSHAADVPYQSPPILRHPPLPTRRARLATRKSGVIIIKARAMVIWCKTPALTPISSTAIPWFGTFLIESCLGRLIWDRYYAPKLRESCIYHACCRCCSSCAASLRIHSPSDSNSSLPFPLIIRISNLVHSLSKNNVSLGWRENRPT